MCALERCSVKEEGWLQTKARKGRPCSYFIFITMGRPVAQCILQASICTLHGRWRLTGKLKYYTEVNIQSANHMPGYCDPDFWRQPKPSQMNATWTSPHPLSCLFFFSFFLSFFFFIGVSDRVIKDYNLSFPEGQRIGLAISNLIFVQVTAKLKFVLPNKIISPNRCSSRVRVPIRKCSWCVL